MCPKLDTVLDALPVSPPLTDKESWEVGVISPTLQIKTPSLREVKKLVKTLAESLRWLKCRPDMPRLHI